MATKKPKQQSGAVAKADAETPQETTPTQVEEAKAPRSAGRQPAEVAWNNKYAVPAPVRVKHEGKIHETTTRSLAFVRSGRPVVFVEGLVDPVPLDDVTPLAAGNPS